MNAKTKDNTLHNTLVYIRQHWQLYVFFLGPALILTIIFKYIPMGGILIAFQKYNPFKGILGSEWVGLKYFQQFLSSPDFMQYLVNTLKLSVYGLLWGFPMPIILALLLNRITIDNGEDKITYDAYPNEQSMSLKAGVKYQVDVVVEKDITVVYVNGEKALSNRIYSAVGADWKVRLQGASIDNLKIYGRKGIL